MSYIPAPYAFHRIFKAKYSLVEQFGRANAVQTVHMSPGQLESLLVYVGLVDPKSPERWLKGAIEIEVGVGPAKIFGLTVVTEPVDWADDKIVLRGEIIA